MNKSFLLLLLFAAIVTQPLSAQSFTVRQHESHITDTLGTEIIFYFTIRNNTQTELPVYIKRTENNIPEKWQSSLCFTSCFAPFVDSIATTPTYSSSPIPAGDSIKISIHIFTQVEHGSGSAVLRIGSMLNPDDAQMFTVTASTLPASVRENSSSVNGFTLGSYPNPFNPETRVQFTLQNSQTLSLEVISVSGEVYKVFSGLSFSMGTHTVPVSFSSLGLSSGIYFIRLSSLNYHELVKAVYLQ